MSVLISSSVDQNAPPTRQWPDPMATIRLTAVAHDLGKLCEAAAQLSDRLMWYGEPF